MKWPRARSSCRSAAFAPSDDGNLLAYSTDNTGYRQYTLHVKNLKTGEMLAENIERVDNVAWATDNKTIFYVTEDAVTQTQRQVLPPRAGHR